MPFSKCCKIDPENMKTDKSANKSGKHGEVFRRQIAQVLLLRMAREKMDFQLAYEHPSADKMDELTFYDREAKQWTFIQWKHADAKGSTIDITGLLPKTNQDTADFSLYKYFQSYMVIRRKFNESIKMILFTNKQLDEKLLTAKEHLTIEDRNVAKYLEFSSKRATHKKLIPTKSTIDSMVDYSYNELHSLKDAIVKLFTDETIENVLVKYKACLNNVLDETKNNEIRFKNTFDDRVVWIAELYKEFRTELEGVKAVNSPLEIDYDEVECESRNLPSVDSQEFMKFKNAIRKHFADGVVAKVLFKYDYILHSILTTSANNNLMFKESFNNEVLYVAKLYEMLKEELPDMMNKVVRTKQKLFDGKGSRINTLPFYAEESDVIEFFEHLTLSAHQPEDLRPFVVGELHSWMRTWLRPDIFSKWSTEDDDMAAKKLDDYFDVSVKQGQEKVNKFLNQHFSEEFYQILQTKIEELHPELKDARLSYINRMVIFEHDETQASDNTMQLSKRIHEELKDDQFAISLRSKFEQYQCLILTADPGLGKTELFQYVAFECQKRNAEAVFLFHLNRLQDFQDCNENNEPLGILKTALSHEKLQLIKNVLENSVEDHISLLFDGYDEVHLRNRNKIDELFTLLLKSKNLKLLISARKHVQTILQETIQKNNVKVKILSLAPFSEANVKEYLAKTWKIGTEVSQTNKFQKYLKLLIENFNSSVQVLGNIPLMVKILAEVYQERFIKFKTCTADQEDEKLYLDAEFLGIEEVYEPFIKTCMLVNVKDATNGILNDLDDLLFERLYLQHQLQAIKELNIEQLYCVFKNPKYKKYHDSDRCLNLCRKSFLLKIDNGKTCFNHRSFAEFFVATFLWDYMFAYQNEWFEVMSHYKTIRRFSLQIIEQNITSEKFNFAQGTFLLKEAVALWACECNAIELLKVILQKISYNSKMLHIAVENGSFRVCSYLIFDRGVNVDELFNGHTTLNSVGISGDQNVLDLLLKRGANINILNKNKETLLHTCASKGHCLGVQLLLERGADVEAIDGNGRTPLHLACMNGTLEVAKLLIERGATIDALDSKKWTPLHRASFDGHCSVAELLLNSGANIGATQRKVRTSLHLACMNGHLDVVKLLIDRGATIDALDNKKWTSLHQAASNGHCSVVELLLNSGANINETCKWGNTPLHLACQNGHLDVSKLLIDRGATIDALDSFKRTPLHLAAFYGHCSVVELLLNSGANINATDKNEWTPLDFACEKGHLDIAKSLIDRGATIDALDYQKWTPLHRAASNGHCSVVELLPNSGANIGAAQEDGRTPLHLACFYGHLDVVKSLIERGATINALDYYTSLFGIKSSNTPLYFARRYKHNDVVEYLKSKGAY